MRALFNYYNITEPHTTSKQVILVISPISILSLVIATPSHSTSYLSSSFVTNFTKFVPALKAERRPADSQVAGDDHRVVRGIWILSPRWSVDRVPRVSVPRCPVSRVFVRSMDCK